jgi:hypothetical protein
MSRINEIVRILGGFAKAFVAIFCEFGPVAFALQAVGEPHADDFVVFNDQNFFLHTQ